MKSLAYFLKQLDEQLSDAHFEKIDWRERSIVHERLRTQRDPNTGGLDIVNTDDTGRPNNNEKFTWTELARQLGELKVTIGGQQVTPRLLMGNALQILAKTPNANQEALKQQIGSMTFSAATFNQVKELAANGDITPDKFRELILVNMKLTGGTPPPAAPAPKGPKGPPSLYDVRTGTATASAPVQSTLTPTGR